jgi:hypothetical protein
MYLCWFFMVLRQLIEINLFFFFIFPFTIHFYMQQLIVCTISSADLLQVMDISDRLYDYLASINFGELNVSCSEYSDVSSFTYWFMRMAFSWLTHATRCCVFLTSSLISHIFCFTICVSVSKSRQQNIDVHRIYQTLVQEKSVREEKGMYTV